MRLVQHHKERRVGKVSGVVDGLQSHATCQGSITNDGNAFERLSPVVPRHGHAQRR